MTDRIQITVGVRDTSLGGAGEPVVVSSQEAVNHFVDLARGETIWRIGLEDIPKLTSALEVVLSTHKAVSPACYNCKRAANGEGPL